MTHQHHCEIGGAGTGRSGLKAGAVMAFARIRTALRMGLESLWRFGVRPPSIPSGLNPFPSLTFVEPEPIAPSDMTGAVERDPFPLPDRSLPRARAAVVQARRPSGSRHHAGH